MNDTTGGEFSSLSLQLKSDVQQITQSVNTLQRLVNQLGTANDGISLRTQLHQLQQRTNQSAKDTNANLQRLSQISRVGIASEQKDRRIFVDRITKDFVDVLNVFQELQRSAAAKERSNVLNEIPKRTLEPIPKPRTHSSNPFYESDVSPYDETTMGATARPQLVLQIEDEERERANLQSISEQNAAIRRLESDITDVNQIFQDLATMIHDQGSIIDNIESNVENTQIRVESGNVQLQRAAEYQMRARKKNLLIIFILVIILMVITVIIYFTVN